MPVLVLDILKYAFVAILYIFVARVVKAVYVEMAPPKAAAPKASRSSSSAAKPQKRSNKAASNLAVIEGDQHKGKTFKVDDEILIGRSDACHVTLEDSYVSTQHARVFTREGKCMLEDLGSTNGTYLNRRRITAPTELQRGDRIKIGRTVMEMRK